MTASLEFPKSAEAFAGLEETVKRCCDLDVRLPQWPFLPERGFVNIFEFDRIMGGRFGGVLEALVSEFGDRETAVVGVSPKAAYYQDGYATYPGFRICSEAVRDGYGVGLRRAPGGDPTGALVDSLNAVAIAGTTARWSVWGQRDWEIGLLLTPMPTGPWLQQGVPAFGRDLDLDSIRSPAGWRLELTERDLATFWANVRARGSGP